MKKWQELNQKTKIMVASGVVLGALGLGGVVYGVTNYTQQQAYQAKVESVASSIDADAQTLKTLQDKINQAYTDNKKTFLKATFTKQALKDLEKSIEDYQEKFAKLIKVYAELKESDTGDFAFKKTSLDEGQKTLKADFKVLSTKAKKQFAVNQLFEKPYLVGNKTTDQPIKATVKKADVEKVKQSSYTKNVTEKQSFEKAINNGIDSAEKQVAQVEKATKAVDNLVKNGKATDKVTKETAEQAKKEVEAIKSETIKKTFDDELKVIEDKVQAEAKVKEEKAKSEAEAKAKEVGGQVEKQADGTFVVKANDGQVYQAKGDGKVEVVKPTQNTSTSQPNTNTGTNTQPSNNGSGNTQTPTQPSNNGGNTQTQPSDNGGGGTTEQPPVNQPVVPTQPLGNSGMLFDTLGQAQDYAEGQVHDPNSQWFEAYFMVNEGDYSKMYGWRAYGIKMSDGSYKYTVNFHIVNV